MGTGPRVRDRCSLRAVPLRLLGDAAVLRRHPRHASLRRHRGGVPAAPYGFAELVEGTAGSPDASSPSSLASLSDGRFLLQDGSAADTGAEPSIELVEDPGRDSSGPIWVRGGVRIVRADGSPFEAGDEVALCRCGQSKRKPFCDGTHVRAGFSTRAARRDEERRPSPSRSRKPDQGTP